MLVFTIGHSTRSLDDFVALLKEHDVARLVDVRRHPGSRRHPHFAKSELERSLPLAGVEYVHAPDLGGRRKASPDSPNGGWRDAGFRGYADYQLTTPFQTALGELAALASSAPTAIMCAEAVPWRCHRQIIADVLVSRGWKVEHIIAPGRHQAHELNPRARAQPDGTVLYPESDQLDLL